MSLRVKKLRKFTISTLQLVVRFWPTKSMERNSLRTPTKLDLICKDSQWEESQALILLMAWGAFSGRALQFSIKTCSQEVLHLSTTFPLS